MKQSAGIITALAAVLALFGLSNLPKSSTGSGSATTAQSDQGVKPPVKAKHDSTINYACGKIQESIQPLVAVNPDQPWRVPSFCYANPEATKDPILIAPENLVFAIAMAPNPIATHLPLLFDRNIEIIEQAAQDNNYSYDSSWLPWGERSRYVRYPDQLAAEESQSDNEKQPGVIVFRNSPKLSDPSPYKSGLVVFVVSELPTGGINREEFKSALGWIEQLKGALLTGELRVLGPTFSGSLPSLYDLLQECQTKSLVCKNKIRLSSGSVSSDSSYSWFKDPLKAEPLWTFDTALEGDCRMLNRFLAYVGNQHYSIRHVAVLSEDETAFGGGAEKEKKKEKKDKESAVSKSPTAGTPTSEAPTPDCTYPDEWTYLYYPRDIATLRSAYEQQSIFKSSKQTSDSTSSSTTTTLRGDLSEPANGHHDTVRTYSGQLTPLAQESVLLSIVDVLKAKDVQFVVVRSTNSLDQIFLGEFLRRSFPDVRIVMDGADLLFRRGAEGSSLRGVMVSSTYPLLAWQQDWTSNDPGESGGSYRIFGQDTSEGLYIAARELLLPDGNTTKDVSDVKISNYAPPAWARSQDDPDVDDDSRPATWLTVIGHRQFWPVAVLNSNTLSAKDPQSKKPQEFKPDSLLAARSNRNDALIAVSGNEHPLRRVPNEFWILVIFCVGWSAAHRLWCAGGSISPLPAPFRLAYFAAIPLWQQPALVGFGSALIAGVGVVLGVAAGFLRWEPASWNFFIG